MAEAAPRHVAVCVAQLSLLPCPRFCPFAGKFHSDMTGSVAHTRVHSDLQASSDLQARPGHEGVGRPGGPTRPPNSSGLNDATIAHRKALEAFVQVQLFGLTSPLVKANPGVLTDRKYIPIDNQ